MKNFTVISLLSLCMYSYALAQDTINWKSDYQINWNDFQGTATGDTSDIQAASILEIQYNLIFYGTSIKCQVFCSFDKTESWTKSQSKTLLLHERGHFNIAELFARKLVKSFKNYKINKSTIDSDLGQLYDTIMTQYCNMTARYDKETDYSLDSVKQYRWTNSIQSELKKLEAYSKKEFILAY